MSEALALLYEWYLAGYVDLLPSGVVNFEANSESSSLADYTPNVFNDAPLALYAVN